MPPIVAVLVALACGACGSREEPGAADTGASGPAEVAAADARRDGRIRVDDAWRPIVPLVIHEARMDLVVSCRLFREQARTAGREVPPLCHGEAKRALGAIRTIRVEHQSGASVDAMRRLAGRAEGAHFIVDRSGSRFQLLDVIYGARRDGLVRDDEIRILAMDGGAPRGAADAVAPLVAELVAMLPGVRVEALDVTPPPPTPTEGGAP